MLVWAHLWSHDVVCCVLRQGTIYLNVLAHPAAIGYWLPMVLTVMDWCPIQGELITLIHLAPKKQETHRPFVSYWLKGRIYKYIFYMYLQNCRSKSSNWRQRISICADFNKHLKGHNIKWKYSNTQNMNCEIYKYMYISCDINCDIFVRKLILSDNSYMDN